MSGVNRATGAGDARVEKPYRLTVIRESEEIVIEVDPADVPYTRTGEPGSILDICEGHNVDLEHTCGGVCACSTCHVIIREGCEATNEPTEDELDQLDEAPGLTIHSRLGCQCVPTGERDMVVEIPGWNRNVASELPKRG